jgi:Bacterial type II/III secretion system short domain
MASMRRTFASSLLLLFLASGAARAQGGEIIMHAYKLKYRRATEAIALVSSLLSPRGTVELQPATNTVVIRDTVASVNKIIPVLNQYDLPARPLTLELYIVRASRSAVSPPVARSNLPDEMTRELRQMLPYDNYDLQARAQLTSLEGQAVTYVVGGEYEVGFRVGAVQGGQWIRLSDFRISRRAEHKVDQLLVRGKSLNLIFGKTMFVGLARDESSAAALMVALTMRPGDVARKVP